MDEIKEESWADSINQFCLERRIKSVNSPEALNPVSFVHSVYEQTGLRSTSLEEFIEKVNSNFSLPEREKRIRDSSDRLTTSSGCGMDALSRFLLTLNPSKQQYERVMRAANRGYLSEYYRAISKDLK